MSSPKEIKNLRLVKLMRELKNLGDAIEEVNKIEELETEIIIESIKRKLSAIEKEKINKINELEEDLRIETVKRRMKQKLVSFKIKHKGRASKKVTELEKEIKAEIIIKTEESKLKTLREILEIKLRKLNAERKIKKERNERTNNRRN